MEDSGQEENEEDTEENNAHDVDAGKIVLICSKTDYP